MYPNATIHSREQKLHILGNNPYHYNGNTQNHQYKQFNIVGGIFSQKYYFCSLASEIMNIYIKKDFLDVMCNFYDFSKC